MRKLRGRKGKVSIVCVVLGVIAGLLMVQGFFRVCDFIGGKAYAGAKPVEEVMLLMRTLPAEAGFVKEDGKVRRDVQEYPLILASIYFRAEASGKSVEEVIKQPHQYSWYNDQKLRTQYEELGTDSSAIQTAYEVYRMYPNREALPKRYRYITGYYNPEIVNPYEDLSTPWKREEVIELDFEEFQHMAVIQKDWVRKMNRKEDK